MKILILGGGQVGSSVAQNLATSKSNDITVVDTNDDVLKKLRDRLDIQTVEGNAALPSVLEQAGAKDTDLLLALTREDSINLAASKIAADIFNIPTCITRIRASDYLEYKEGSALTSFSVDESICPEQLVTDHLYQLFEHPGSLQVLSFADGKAQMVAVSARLGGKLIGKPIKEIRNDLPEGVDGNICAIYRNNRLITPEGDTVIIEGDEVFIIGAKDHIPLLLDEVRHSERKARKVIVAGGGNIGFRLASRLEHHFDVKVIENRQTRAEWLSENLNDSLVLLGSSTDETLLKQENIDETDVFCAVTNDDENNIMSALLAKRYGAKRVMALINRSSYVSLIEGNSIDIVISPHMATIGSILAYIRRGDIEGVYPLRHGSAEIMEAIIHGNKDTSKLIGRSIEDIALPKGCYINAIIRNEQVLIAHHDLVLEDNDHVIFFVSRNTAVKELEKLIQVKLGFF
ncbi:Trk system potassium transporter TrkA [Neisseria sp. Ec49-e6-T10]|uniref:Trk system potassium transporter TrkA n=1 Tax=Neisseria sp. Ec49-e6-T10 TaxID=3140744 RepID=UPI003EBA22A9